MNDLNFLNLIKRGGMAYKEVRNQVLENLKKGRLLRVELI